MNGWLDGCLEDECVNKVEWVGGVNRWLFRWLSEGLEEWKG